MSEKKTITRRQFIKDTSAAAVGSTLFLGAPAIKFGSSSSTKTTVVLVRDKDVLDANGRPRFPVVLKMLDTAVTTLTGKKDPVEAWKTLVTPGDIVGIKTNVWSRLSTTPQVEQVLKKRVMDAGVSETNIGIQDRGIWKDSLFKKATALINARPMRSHHWAGVGSLVKNYITFVPTPWAYHNDSCADLAKLWKLPLVKGKTRLNVLVMLTPQFHGVGPHSFSPRYVWTYYGLMVGFDPVAVDSIGVRIIQAKRKAFFGEERPLNPPPKHIFLADTRHHLGTADPNKINLIKTGYDKEIFV
jgi:hypothetical protein